MDDELDPLALDRKIERAAAAWQQFRRRLRAGQAFDEDPLAFHREVAGRTLFQRLQELGEYDPLAPYLRRWTYRLTEQRINTQALLALELERIGKTHVIDSPEHARVSVRDLLKAALRDAPRRRAWVASFLRFAPELSVHSGLLWERRAEVARRMAVELDVIELAGLPIAAEAERLLQDTADMASGFRRRTLHDYLSIALGSELSEGWPARLQLRSLADLFAESRLLEGLPLSPGPFPEAISGASFMRGLLRLGAAWSDATAPRQQPFVVRHDPYGLRRRATGALFAGLALSSAFNRRALGLSPTRARERARAVARVMLLDVRSAALRVQLRVSALEGRAAFASAFEGGVERVFGLGLRGALAGAIFRLHLDDGQRLAGVLLAAARTQALVNAHDEDWFRNPRAVDQLRSEAELSPEITASEAELSLGRSALTRALHEALA